jgi:hypothetical protein
LPAKKERVAEPFDLNKMFNSTRPEEKANEDAQGVITDVSRR